MSTPTLEVCVDSVDSAVAAQLGGAHRVELCSALVEGGLTPSLGTIRATRRAIDIELAVMIRPRGGDFCYSPRECEVMLADIAVARAERADVVVIGALRANGEIDREIVTELIDAARPLPVTFHRAFDRVVDPFAALDTLIELGVDRVLSSGQQATAFEGRDLLARLMARAAGRIVIMPGGGIRAHNVQAIVSACRPRELHASASQVVHSPMQTCNTRVPLAGSPLPDDARRVTAVDQVRALIAAASTP